MHESELCSEMLWGVTSWVKARPRARPDLVLVNNNDSEWRHELYMNVLECNTKSYPWVMQLTREISLPINLDVNGRMFAVMEPSFDAFIEKHSHVPVIHAFGVYEPSVDKFLTYLPMPHLPRPNGKRVLCGGVIQGRANSSKTTRCIQGLFGRGKSLFILPKEDEEVLKWVTASHVLRSASHVLRSDGSHNFASTSHVFRSASHNFVARKEWNVDLKSDMVIIHHGMIREWKDVLSCIEWEHVVFDTLVNVEFCDVLRMKCLWIIADKTSPREWSRMFRLEQVFGAAIPEEMVKAAFGNYLVYLCGGQAGSNRRNWRRINCRARYTEDVPLGAMHRKSTSIDTLLAIEYDQVDKYAMTAKLNQREFVIKEIGFREITCGICFEDTLFAVKNKCSHWFCDACMYRVVMTSNSCPLCRCGYDAKSFEGSTKNVYPKFMTQFVTRDLSNIITAIEEEIRTVLVIVNRRAVHELLVLLQYQFPQRNVVVNMRPGINDTQSDLIIVATPRHVKRLRYQLFPELVICLTLRESLLPVLEWCMSCPVLFAAPKQSMTNAIIHEDPDFPLWEQYIAQF